MLNDFIRKTNKLGRELASCRAKMKNGTLPLSNMEEYKTLEIEYKKSLEETLRFIADNNVPRDTVAIIEDRILREMRIRDDEDMLREKLSLARTATEEAAKEVDWLRRSVDSGLGSAQARFIQAKAKMDDFYAEYSNLPMHERSALCGTFAQLDKEYTDTKSEFLRVGVTDRAAILNNLKAAQQKLAGLQSECTECEERVRDIPLTAPIVATSPGSGEICRALDGVKEPALEEIEVDEIFTAEVFEDNEPPRSIIKAPIQKPQIDRPVKNKIVTGNDEISVQISEAVSSVLKNNERFKYILEEVRFQASLEVSKVRAEVERIKNEAFKEAQRLTDELRQLKQDAAYIRQEAARARIAMNTVNKAQATATLNAQRTVTAAKKTVAAARRAIDAAKSASFHNPN